MKKALRTLIALVVATAMIGGGFAGTAAAQDTITDTSLVELDGNIANPVTSIAVNALNLGGEQSIGADVGGDYGVGDNFGITN
ncbi:hypothetical protein [Halomicrobium salinisoli]|uniref:hypothetical protein n=1 Tax=Halomicrobium salinisoli TaxID=2878391 RepID=UPI001CF089B2|nr:hypothetical protein [Halomicrobium salinisoli]